MAERRERDIPSVLVSDCWKGETVRSSRSLWRWIRMSFCVYGSEERRGGEGERERGGKERRRREEW